MSLTVKIKAGSKTKAILFASHLSIAECQMIIQEKMEGEGGTDHAIFQRTPITRWLEPNKTLQFYDLVQNDELEFIKKHRPTRVKFIDGSMKTVLVDWSKTVGEILEEMGKTMHVSIPEEFGLQIEGKEGTWLNATKGLYEQGVNDDNIFLFRQHYYYAKIDEEDAFTIHVAYLQCVQDVISGFHDCTQEEAVGFAALQTQVKLGNYDPSKMISKLDIKECLPPNFQKIKKIDEKIVREHKKLSGMTEATAKFRYYQLCRSLKTYGYVFFSVRLQGIKNSKKEKPFLMGVSANIICFSNIETKQVVRELTFRRLKNWSTAHGFLRLESAEDIEEEYKNVYADDLKEIADYMKGYVNIYLKRKKDKTQYSESNDENVAEITSVAAVSSNAITSFGYSGYGTMAGAYGQTFNQTNLGGAQQFSRYGTMANKANPTNLSSAMTHVSSLIDDYRNTMGQPIQRNVSLTAAQWKKQLLNDATNISGFVAKMTAALPPNAFNRSILDQKAGEIAMSLGQLIAAAKNASLKSTGETDINLLDAAKVLADAIKDLLSSARDLADNPNDPRAIERYQAAQKAFSAAVMLLQSSCKDNAMDDSSVDLLHEAAKNISLHMKDLLGYAPARPTGTEKKPIQANITFNNATESSRMRVEELQQISNILAPAMFDMNARNQLNLSVKAVEAALLALKNAANEQEGSDLSNAIKEVMGALSYLLTSSNAGELADTLPQFSTASNALYDELAKLMSISNDPYQVASISKQISNFSSQVVNVAQKMVPLVDDTTKEQLQEAVKRLAAATTKFIKVAGTVSANMEDEDAKRDMYEAARRIGDALRVLIGDVVERSALKLFRGDVRTAIASTVGLANAARIAATSCSDPSMAEQLKKSAKSAMGFAEAITKTLENATKNSNDAALQRSLIDESGPFAEGAIKLQQDASASLPHIHPKESGENNEKDLLDKAIKLNEQALFKLKEAGKFAIISITQAQIDEAVERFGAEEAILVATLIDIENNSYQRKPPSVATEAMKGLTDTSKTVTSAIRSIALTAQKSPEELGVHSKLIADSIVQMNAHSRDLAYSSDNRVVQTGVVGAAQDLTIEARNMLTAARAAASHTDTPAFSGLLAQSAKRLAQALVTLVSASKGTQTLGIDCDEAVAAIAAAVQTLQIQSGGNPKDFPVLAEELERNVREVKVTSNALYAAFKTKTKTVSAAIRTAATSVTSMIKSTNAALASSSDPATQQALIMAVYEIANAVATLVQTMKNALMQDDAQANESVAQASRDILPAIDRLMSALNDTPVLKQFQQALDSVNQSVNYLTQPLNDIKSEKAASVNSNIVKLKAATGSLAESARSLIDTSKREPEAMGEQAFTAADSISTVVENVVAMALGTKVSVYKEDAFTLREAGQRLVNACHLHDPTSARPLLISSGKDVAEAVSKIIQKIRTEAQNAKDDEHTQLLKSAATSLAQIASALGSVAKDSLNGVATAKDAADEAFHSLESTLEYLVSKDPSQQVTQKSRRLVTVTTELCNATTQLIEAGRNAHKKPTDANAQSELQGAAVGVAKAIRDLTDMSRAFGDLDMDDSVTKVSHAISELDSASISATVGQLEDRSGGQSPQDLEEGLVEISRRMAALIKNLVATEKDSIGVFAKTTKSLADLVPQLATVSIQRASITSDPDAQQRILSAGKEMADVVLAICNAIKASNVDDIIKFAKEANNVNTKILTSVKSAVFALKECDEAVKMIAEFAKPLQTYDLKKQLSGSRDYANNQQELTKLAKEMVGAISGMVTSAKIKPIEVGDNAKKVANLIPVLVKNITEALGAITEVEARTTLHNGARVVIVATTGLIQKAKLVAADPKNAKNNQQLSIAYKEVTESIAGLVAAIKAGATGEVKCEEAVEAITRRIGDLDSAALFAASGQLTSDNDDVDLLDLQTKISDGCNMIVQHLSNFVQSTENQLEMGNAALRATEAFDKIAKDSRTVAAAVTSLLDQQEVLMGAKNVGVSIQLLLTSGLSLNKNPEDDELREDLTEFAIRVNNTIRDLLDELNAAISKGSSGVRDLETARKTVQQLIDTFSSLPPSRITTAQDILGPAKGLVDAVVNITTLASSPKDIDKFIEATQALTQCTSDILHRSKGTGNLMKPQEAQTLVNAAANIAQSACKFLEVTKAHKKKGNLETGRLLSESNDELVRVISEIAEAVRPLPGSEEALRLFQEAEELEAKTEEQLQLTAESVMRAYNTLAGEQQNQVRSRENPEGPSPSEQISEAILEAAVAMATSTVHLVNAAATAQKELVSKNKTADRSQSIYKKDPAWAKGLIAACKEVGSATDSLTDSSVGVAHGSKSPDALEASAKAVAAATAKLVFASKTKADPFSPTQKKMSDYARAIAAATKQLIEAAHYVQQNTSKEDENRPDWDAGEDSARQAEIEHQIKILKLAKELENAQRRLIDMKSKKPGKKLAPGEKEFTLAELQKKPADVDHAVLEQYLSDEEFKAVFKIDKKTFGQMPEQKRNAAKKIMGLL